MFLPLSSSSVHNWRSKRTAKFLCDDDMDRTTAGDSSLSSRKGSCYGSSVGVSVVTVGTIRPVASPVPRSFKRISNFASSRFNISLSGSGSRETHNDDRLATYGADMGEATLLAKLSRLGDKDCDTWADTCPACGVEHARGVDLREDSTLDDGEEAMQVVLSFPSSSSSFVLGLTNLRRLLFSSCHIISMGFKSGLSAGVGQ